MIKTLRRKFVLVSICSVTAVLLVIMSVVNIANYIKVNEDANRKLAILAKNDGSFKLPEKPKAPMEKQKEDFLREPNLSPETPYETRYFSVRFDSNDKITKVDIGFIAAVSGEEAESYAKKAISKNKASGFIDNYKFVISTESDEKLVIMLDCSRDLSNFRYFLLTSVLVSVLGILGVLVLVLVFSKLAVKPIVESYEKQKRFITDASHEIKTPLTIIDASTEVLEMENRENEWTQSIKNQVQRLSKLTSNLIYLSRMDEGNYELQMDTVSVSNIVAESLEPFISLAEINNKRLDIDIEEGLLLKANAAAFGELISILTDNAMTYSDDYGEIAVKLKKHNRQIILSVYNTAREIKIGNHDMLFERFYRGDESRSTETGGYGIGLSSAKAIVEAHSGKITARSDDGKSLIVTAVF